VSQYFDVVVVGGGVIGCSVAFHLAKKGVKVMVVEKNAIGGQASSVAAGMLAAQEEAAKPDAFSEACRESRALFKTLVPEVRELSGIDPEYEICGMWRVAASEVDVPELLDRKRRQEALGLAVEWHFPGQLAERNPGLAHAVGGLYFPEDGQINSAKWALALAEAGRRLGVRFLDRAMGVEFARDGRRVSGVRAQGELFAADRVVLAAGAWTSLLLESLGLSLPLEPVKGQLMILGGAPRAFGGPIFAASGYLVPKADGRLIVGSTMERVGFNVRPTLEAQRILADWVARWAPAFSAYPTVEFQAGLRPGTRDGWPVMGQLWDYDNLFISAGHFRNGILLSPLAGRAMADGIVNGRWAPSAAAFAPERFRPVGAGTP